MNEQLHLKYSSGEFLDDNQVPFKAARKAGSGVLDTLKLIEGIDASLSNNTVMTSKNKRDEPQGRAPAEQSIGHAPIPQPTGESARKRAVRLPEPLKKT